MKTKSTSNKYQPTIGYKNGFNNYIVPKMSAPEMNIYAVILHKLKQTGGKQVIQMSVSQMLDYLQVDRRNSASIANNMDSFMTKIMSTSYFYLHGSHTGKIMLFTQADYDHDKKVLTLKPNFDFPKVFEFLTSQATFYDLNNFIVIKGRYAKAIYRHLMQFKTSGKWKVTPTDFNKLIQVPESYVKNGQVKTNIIDPAIKELRYWLPNLRIRVDRPHKVHAKSSLYTFTFTPVAPKSIKLHVEPVNKPTSKPKQDTSTKPDKDISSIVLPFE